jgi:chaperonin GroES
MSANECKQNNLHKKKRGDYKMNIKPLGDKVVIKRLEAEEKTKSGIVLPNQAKEQPQLAKIMAVGPGGLVDGKEIKMEVKVGDTVIFSKYSGTEIKYDGEEYTIVSQKDILAVVK